MDPLSPALPIERQVRTVDGRTEGSVAADQEPDPARRRSPARMELVRRLDGVENPISWSLRMFNGAGDPQITVFLPNPFLFPEDRIAATPDRDRLALWDALFPRPTGQSADGRDRLGKGCAKI